MNHTSTQKKVSFMFVVVALATLCNTTKTMKIKPVPRILFNQQNTKEKLIQHVGNVVKLWNGEDKEMLDKDPNTWFSLYEKAKKTFNGEDGGLSTGTQWTIYNYMKPVVYGTGGLASWQTSSFSLDLKKFIQNIAPICIIYAGSKINTKLNNQCKKCEKTFMKKAGKPLKNLLAFLKYEKKNDPFKIPSKRVTKKNMGTLKSEINVLQTQRDLLPALCFASRETLLPLTNVQNKMTEIIVGAQKIISTTK